MFFLKILLAGLGTTVMASQHQLTKMVPSYLSPQQRRDPTAYWEAVRSHLGNNKYIPQPGPDTFRVATYNIHYYRDIKDERDNLEAMLKDIKRIDPSVVVLQEVPSSDSARVLRKLQQIGYGGVRLDINKKQGKLVFCGNLVAAKTELKLKHLETLYLDEIRNAIAVSVHWKGYDIAVIGTHLHDDYREGWVRKREAEIIMGWINKAVTPNYLYYLVLGDMNEGWAGDGVQVFPTQGMVEVFRGLGGAHPQMTCWAGVEIDFIFSSTRLMGRCVGAFLWHSVQSDHMPVLADFEIPNRFGGEQKMQIGKQQFKAMLVNKEKAATSKRWEKSDESEEESDSSEEKAKKGRRHRSKGKRKSKRKSKSKRKQKSREERGKSKKEDRRKESERGSREGAGKVSKKRSRPIADEEPVIKRLKSLHELKESSEDSSGSRVSLSVSASSTSTSVSASISSSSF